MANYTYRYEVTDCPDCGADLTQEEAITISVIVGSRPNDVKTRLDKDGNLIDVQDAVWNGYHGGTRCSSCGESLEDYEEQTTY